MLTVVEWWALEPTLAWKLLSNITIVFFFLYGGLKRRKKSPFVQLACYTHFAHFLLYLCICFSSPQPIWCLFRMVKSCWNPNFLIQSDHHLILFDPRFMISPPRFGTVVSTVGFHQRQDRHATRWMPWRRMLRWHRWSTSISRFRSWLRIIAVYRRFINLPPPWNK